MNFKDRNPASDPSDRDEERFALARSKMVQEQLRKRGITDPQVLAAMQRVPRHKFVPPEEQADAYKDNPLAIGFDQTISQPYIVALMSEALSLRRDDSVLEIGTGSGYQTAVIAELCASVLSIEIVETLGVPAKERLKQMGYKNVRVEVGNGYDDWVSAEKFNKIIVTAAPETLPSSLVRQLADGGKMVIPVGGNVQILLLVEKNGDQTVERKLANVRFVPMVDSA